MLSVTLGAGFLKFHQFFQMLLVMGGGGGGGGGGDSSTAFYSVKLCVMTNLNVVLYSMYNLYADQAVGLQCRKQT